MFSTLLGLFTSSIGNSPHKVTVSLQRSDFHCDVDLTAVLGCMIAELTAVTVTPGSAPP
jgi:hypothetical protein